jgi:hypothetical protein
LAPASQPRSRCRRLPGAGSHEAVNTVQFKEVNRVMLMILIKKVNRRWAVFSRFQEVDVKPFEPGTIIAEEENKD